MARARLVPQRATSQAAQEGDERVALVFGEGVEGVTRRGGFAAVQRDGRLDGVRAAVVQENL
jgi:hypothetical protein